MRAIPNETARVWLFSVAFCDRTGGRGTFQLDDARADTDYWRQRGSHCHIGHPLDFCLLLKRATTDSV